MQPACVVLSYPTVKAMPIHGTAMASLAFTTKTNQQESYFLLKVLTYHHCDQLL